MTCTGTLKPFSIERTLNSMEKKALKARLPIDKGWKEVLNNQFHDSLPGSHIPVVYKDLREAYDRALSTGNTIVNNSINTRTVTYDIACFD